MSIDADREEVVGVLEAALRSLNAEPESLRRARSVGLNRRWPRGHFHPMPGFIIQTGGATRFEGPEQRWELAAGELGLLPRGVPHAETPLDRATPYGKVVACCGRTGFTLIQAHAPVNNGAAGGGREIAPLVVLPVASVRGREAFRYLDEVEQAWAEGVEGREPAVDLTRVFLRVLAEEARRAEPGSQVYSPVVESARAVARSYLADLRLSVQCLARTAGC